MRGAAARYKGKVTCELCEHFNLRDDGPTAISGYCRRYPPAFLIEESYSDGFPNVRLTDWCGEFRKAFEPLSDTQPEAK